MVKVIPGAITNHQIHELKEYYKSKEVNAHTPNYSNNKNLEYHDEEDISYKIFNPVFSELLGDHEFDTGAFKQSLEPYPIHTDSRERHIALGCYLFGTTVKHNLAIICPLESGDYLKTLVFKYRSIHNPSEDEEHKKSLITSNGLEYNNYKHCGSLVTQLEVDIEYSWQAGDLLIFYRDQWHCSNYFKVNKDTKDFLIFFIA